MEKMETSYINILDLKYMVCLDKKECPFRHCSRLEQGPKKESYGIVFCSNKTPQGGKDYENCYNFKHVYVGKPNSMLDEI